MRKFVLMAVAMALVAALPAAGAQAKTKTKQISTDINLDVAGYIDRHGGVFYFWGGDLDAKRSACRDGRNVTLFRVESNGTATPVGSNTTLSSSGDPTVLSVISWRDPWAQSRAPTTRRSPRSGSRRTRRSPSPLTREP